MNDSFIILDEAQNSTAEQMKMFLTRLGFNSKMVITGDVTQVDLPASRGSGLIEVQSVLRGVPGIRFVFFDDGDVVRHQLVSAIVRAYDAHDARKGERGSATRATLMPAAVTNRQDRVAVSPARLARTAGRALAAVGRAAGDVDVLVVDDPAIKRLNRLHRGVDRRTDVLAFPLETPGPSPLVGQIVISAQTARRQARQVDVSLATELDSARHSRRAPSGRLRRPRSGRGAPDARARAPDPLGRPPPAAGALWRACCTTSRSDRTGAASRLKRAMLEPGRNGASEPARALSQATLGSSRPQGPRYNDQPRRVRVAHRSAQRRKVDAPEPDGR